MSMAMQKAQQSVEIYTMLSTKWCGSGLWCHAFERCVIWQSWSTSKSVCYLAGSPSFNYCSIQAHMVLWSHHLLKQHESTLLLGWTVWERPVAAMWRHAPAWVINVVTFPIIKSHLISMADLVQLTAFWVFRLYQLEGQPLLGRVGWIMLA